MKKWCVRVHNADGFGTWFMFCAQEDAEGFAAGLSAEPMVELYRDRGEQGIGFAIKRWENGVLQ